MQTLLTAMLAGCRIPTPATTSQTSCSDRPGPWTAPPTPASASAATTPRTWGPWWVSTTRATPPPPAAWYGRSSCRHVRHVSCVITWHSCVQWSVRAPLVCDKKYCRNTYITPILRTLKTWTIAVKITILEFNQNQNIKSDMTLEEPFLEGCSYRTFCLKLMCCEIYFVLLINLMLNLACNHCSNPSEERRMDVQQNFVPRASKLW